MNDSRDKVISAQMEVIETLLKGNMRRIADDFGFGIGRPANSTPAEKPSAPQNIQVPKQAEPVKTAAPTAQQTPATEAEAVPVESMDDIRKELDSLIGLKGIKQEVNNLINLATVHKLREANGLKTVDMSLHMVFSGNPGTGKTTIARIMAKVYRSLGILSKGQLIEVDRSGLVAGYVGQTAGKTSKVIESAMGGVLFIDEAYALNSKSENDFGQEAIDTLLKAMEDHRKDLIVIVAGYDGLMDDFIHSNPGLESRFNRYLHFDDYSVDEMLAILEMQLKKGQYTMDDEARAAAREYIEVSNTSNIAFGNARGVRNIFEKLLTEQANRLAATENPDKNALMEITAADVEAARNADTQLKKAERARSEAEEQARKTLDELNTLLQTPAKTEPVKLEVKPEPDKAVPEEKTESTDSEEAPAEGE